jgi:hypothetical protein
MKAHRCALGHANLGCCHRITDHRDREPSTYKALDRLTAAGILDIVSAARRNRIGAAIDVIALDALSAAIGRRAKRPQ